MSGIHTETIKPKHAYTRSDVPWEEAKPGVMRAHGETVRQAELARRQRHFAIFAAAFALAWTLLYFL